MPFLCYINFVNYLSYGTYTLYGFFASSLMITCSLPLIPFIERVYGRGAGRVGGAGKARGENGRVFSGAYDLFGIVVQSAPSNLVGPVGCQDNIYSSIRGRMPNGEI